MKIKNPWILGTTMPFHHLSVPLLALHSHWTFCNECVRIDSMCMNLPM